MKNITSIIVLNAAFLLLVAAGVMWWLQKQQIDLALSSHARAITAITQYISALQGNGTLPKPEALQPKDIAKKDIKK